MQAILVMFRSDGERRSFSIMRDMTVIGRREDCDLRIPLSDVSRKHCRLVRDGETLRLEDLGSSNGTYRNGERVQEAMLSPGDTLQVGPVQFVLQIDGQPADDELVPAESAAGASGEAEYAAEEPVTEAEAMSGYDVTESADISADVSDIAAGSTGAHELSENATIDESVETPAAAPRTIAAAPAKKTNGVHAPPPPAPPAPAAATSDEGTPFHGLDEGEAGGEEPDFFILDEPSSGSQSGEIQIDMDTPQA